MDGAAEHALLRDIARGFLGAGPRSAVELAEMGWTALAVDEELGGAGWRPVEACLVAEELGRAHDASGWIATTVAAAAVARAGGTARARWLEPLLVGAETAAFGVDGPVVTGAGGPFGLVVLADADALLLAELPAHGIRPLEGSLDTTRDMWTIEVPVSTLVTIGDAAVAAELAALARLLVTADALGAFTSAAERLLTHLRRRVAFGAPLASFQTIQHRLVDLLVLEVRARAILYTAARQLAARAPTATPTALVAHAFLAEHVVAALDECVQLSGAIGFTWEYPLHHELRRVLADTMLLGTARDSRAHLAAACGW